MKFSMLGALALLLVGCGSGGGNNTVATGPNGMSVDKNGAIHDNHGNTYTAPPATISEKDFPVPFYPGSKGDGAEDGLADIPIDGGKRNLIAQRITTDPVDKVVAFYKDKLPGETDMGAGGNTSMNGKWPDGKTCNIIVSKEDRGTTIGMNVVENK